MSWNENMVDVRKEAGHTQIDMSKKIGWSRAQIQRYEKGEYPTIEYLIAFCKLYKVNPDRILYEELNGGK